MSLQIKSVVFYCGLLLFTFLVACFIRIANHDARMQWIDDSARDIIVAKKVAESGTYTQLHPLSGASGDVLKNSSLYYNTLAFFWSIGNSKSSLEIGYISLGIISLFAGWAIGTSIGGKWLGLLCFFLLAICTPLAEIQLSIYQRNILPTVALLIVSVAILAVRTPNLKKIVLLEITYTLGILLHYSLLTFAPAVGIVILFTLWKSDTSVKKKLITIGISSTACLITWMICTQSTPSDLANFSRDASQNTWTSSIHILEAHYSAVDELLKHVAPVNSFFPLLKVALVLSYLIGCGVSFISRTSNAFRVFILFLSTYVMTHLVFFKQGFFFFSSFYMLHYLPLLIILLPLVCYELLQGSSLLIKRGGFCVIAIVFCALELQNIRNLEHEDYFTNEQAATKQIVQRIWNDYSRINVKLQSKNFVITEYDGKQQPDWFLPAYLFHLEEMTGESFSTLSMLGNNLDYTFAYPADVIYVICTHRMGDTSYRSEPEYSDEMCIDPYMHQILTSKLIKNFESAKAEIIIKSTENNIQINVFRVLSF